jgi:NAD(P)-dependent dehydrogenase (short-subunit alcohol dehydrogenase family)
MALHPAFSSSLTSRVAEGPDDPWQVLGFRRDSRRDVTDEPWERVFAVNATGPMRAIRKALPIFIEKGAGFIVMERATAGISLNP